MGELIPFPVKEARPFGDPSVLQLEAAAIVFFHEVISVTIAEAVRRFGTDDWGYQDAQRLLQEVVRGAHD